MYAAMRIQDTDVWNDPLVQETLAGVTDGGELSDEGDVNGNPVMKMLLETDCLEPVAVSMVIGSGAFVRRENLPPSVSGALDLAQAERVREEGPAHLFEAGNASALRFVLAEFASEATGDAYKNLVARPDFKELKPHVDAAAENVVALAEGLIDSGMWREMPPKLLDKFVECMENVRSMSDSMLARRGISSAISSFKTAVAEGTAREMAEMRAPCIDPSSRYAAMKHIAKTKYRLQ